MLIAALRCFAAEIWKPCMPLARASLFAASTIKCTCVRCRLTCTIRKSSRSAVVSVASRIA